MADNQAKISPNTGANNVRAPVPQLLAASGRPSHANLSNVTRESELGANVSAIA